MRAPEAGASRDLERELRKNLVYRRSPRFDAEVTPDFTTFSRTFAFVDSAGHRTN